MLIPLLFVPQANVNAALDRYASFMKPISTISADIRVRTNISIGEGVGKIVLKRPNLTFFQMTYNGVQYAFFQNESRIVEVDRAARQYRDYMTFESWTQPPGDINTIPQFGFPTMILNSDLREASGLSSFKLVGATPGIRAKTISAKQQVMGGFIDYEFKIDELGRPIRIRSTANSVNGKVVIDQYFTNWVVDKPVPKTTFLGALPSGYSAAALPTEPFPVTVGEAFPSNGWIIATTPTGSPSAFSSGKPFLVAIVDQKSIPSNRLIGFLKKNGSSIPIGVALIWNSKPGNSQGFDSFVGARKSAAYQLRLAGTPALYHINGRGSVEHVWIGFDSRAESSLLRELVAALKS